MANQIDPADRTAVVTGGAQGIGRAITTRLLDSDAAVAIWRGTTGAVLDISGGRATY